MTTRHAGYVITLDRDIREDDAERLIEVLRHLKGVSAVDPVESDITLLMATERIRSEVEIKIHEAVRAICSGKPIPGYVDLSP